MENVELMERAAKAAGLTLEESIYPEWFMCGGRQWNPLVDDGDALRLAAKLHIECKWPYPGEILAVKSGGICITEEYDDDGFAAIRRAIVRAAASVN